MAVLKAEAVFDLEPVKALIKVFPDLGGQFLALAGKKGRHVLKEELLSGQFLTLRKYPVDKSRHRTISADINKRRTQVKIYSYPANFFEHGRMLRSGTMEPGRKIVTGHLKQIMSGRMTGIVAEFERDILNPEIAKVGLK